MTFWWADGVLAMAGMATTAVRQAAAKAKLAEILRIMTSTCELGAVANVCEGVSVPHKFRDRCTEPGRLARPYLGGSLPRWIALASAVSAYAWPAGWFACPAAGGDLPLFKRLDGAILPP
jgi:hypothetical protein